MAKSIGEEILERIKSLEDKLNFLLIHEKLEELESKVKSITSIPEETLQPKPSLKESIDNLENFAVTQKDASGKRTFLLHRITKDFEYENSALTENTYETKQNTEWTAEVELAEANQKDKNPVVGCYIPEDAIVEIPNAIGNTNTFDDLGKNPNSWKYKIIVKPGTYKIHSELRE